MDRISASVADVRTHVQRLIQLNVELFKAELAEKGRLYGVATGLFVAAAVLALYAVGFLLATIVVALDLVLPLWLALLIVTAALFVIVAILVSVGRRRLDRAKAQSPQAMSVAQQTARQLRENLGETAASASPRGRGRSGESASPEQIATGARPAPPGPGRDGQPPTTPRS